jgi:hypothetical protein
MTEFLKGCIFVFLTVEQTRYIKFPKFSLAILKEIVETHSQFTTHSNIINLQIDQ